jgi:hypothetical protein
MPGLTAYAHYVLVGRPGANQVPPDRVAFYQWLLPTIFSANRCRVVPKDIYITTNEMKTNPRVIRRLLEHDPPDEDGRASAVLVDLAENAYYLIRDIFLFHVMDMAQRWLASRPKLTVIILLPGAGLPSPASMFWMPLAESPAREYAGRLIVITNDAVTWPSESNYLIPRTEYVRRRNHPTRSLIEQLELRMIRKPGHYALGSRDDPYCARYFFETEQAEHEIGELVIDWVQNVLRPSIPPGAELTLVSQAKQSETFHDAIAGAATSLDCSFRKISDPEMLASHDLGSGWVAPIFHAVNSGATYRRIVSGLQAVGANVTSEALTIMLTGHDKPPDVNGVHLRSLCVPRNRERVVRTRCDQCRLNLPHTPVMDEEQMGIRAFDMWAIFFDCDWGREQFGAPKKQLYPHLPDMRDIFSKHGNWIAYKVQSLLKALGSDEEVAFVCPEEANIEELTLHLGILMQNRQVTVRVPPAVIRGQHWKREVIRRHEEDWQRQLRHLRAQRLRSVVIIDEFAGSKATADGLARLLRFFEVEPFAYVPIIDFSPDLSIRGLPTYPLYRLPNPRVGQ